MPEVNDMKDPTWSARDNINRAGYVAPGSLLRAKSKDDKKYNNLKHLLTDKDIPIEHLTGSEVNKIILEMSEHEVAETSTFRRRIHHFLESTPVIITIIVMVILDCVLVIVALFLDFRVSKDNLNMCVTSVKDYACHGKGNKNITTATSGYHFIRKRSAPSGGLSPCEEAAINFGDFHLEHTLELYFHCFSIAILCIFMIEIIFRFYALGPRSFFRSKIETLDAIVVIISLVLDVLLLVAPFRNDYFIFLSVVLFWRVIRIINTILATYKHRMELRMKLQKAITEKYEKRSIQQGYELAVLQSQLQAMVLLARLHVSESVINATVATAPRPTSRSMHHVTGLMFNLVRQTIGPHTLPPTGTSAGVNNLAGKKLSVNGMAPSEGKIDQVKEESENEDEHLKENSHIKDDEVNSKETENILSTEKVENNSKKPTSDIDLQFSNTNGDLGNEVNDVPNITQL